MTPLLFAGICAAGGLGAALRFILDGIIKARTQISYPVGTTFINVTGSLLLGIVTGMAATLLLPDPARLIIGTGLLGGYTTFSTASFETIRLAQEHRVLPALANGLGMLILSTIAAAAGYLVGTLL
ncbi:fluoride efflux transporter CrcB [Arthrobacter yangruifuii]|uniref:Fluoride-specific ion channel FluC n=1 Tax=Arthrobacter yangruifuii TaxID=2606616 RepID=A0A5N6MU71_9MICC|nr:fluoride efflux transporter CrcB [Arthrobacter yangruifuii]KAD4060452.1 fluoride efflux transporter CrcB [Arthrobacter yangruifuii]